MTDPEEHSAEEEGEEPRQLSAPAKVLGSLFMILLLIMWVIPHYAIESTPDPDGWETVQLPTITDPEPPLDRLEQVPAMEVTQPVRNLALRLASTSCPSDAPECNAKAFFYFVRDRISYVSDPAYEYVQHPEETMLGAGDCEDKSVLLYALMRAVDIPARIVVITGHAYLQIRLPGEAPVQADEQGWINLDPTCSSCDFGEIPHQNSDARVLKHIP